VKIPSKQPLKPRNLKKTNRLQKTFHQLSDGYHHLAEKDHGSKPAVLHRCAFLYKNNRTCASFGNKTMQGKLLKHTYFMKGANTENYSQQYM
jgi:hypothetical protein